MSTREITIEDRIIEEAAMRKLKGWVMEALAAKREAERRKADEEAQN